MFGSVFLTGAFFYLIYKAFFWYIEFSSFKRRLDPIPGPKGWPVIGSVPELMQRLRKKELTNLIFEEYPEKYGRIYCFWTLFVPRIGLASAKYAEALLTSTRIIKKSIDYELLRDWLGDGLLISTGEKWKTRRRLLTPAFHFNILENFVPIFVSCAANFVEQLRLKAAEGESFDVYPMASLASLDAVCECAMGVEVKAQESEESEYVKAVKRMSEIANARSLQPWYASNFVFYLSPTGREQRRLLKVVHGFTRHVIAQRREELKEHHYEEENTGSVYSKGKKRAFLDLLLSPGLQLSDADIQEEVDTFMFEGHDTTGAGIAWCMYELGLNPGIQERASEEVSAVLASNNGVVDSKSLNEMKYLECCIKEAQRVHPSVPAIVREATEDFQAGEYTIPKGSQVSVLILSVHNDPEVYPNPKNYNPDRFFNDEVSSRHPYAFIPFSAGLRNCIGQRFAMLETKAVLATVLQNFNIKSRDPLSFVRPQSDVILKPENGLFIELEERHHDK